VSRDGLTEDTPAGHHGDTGSVMDRRVVKMYRNSVDQTARSDIAAAAAAHQEMGRDYDAAVAEGLIERIGAEIDSRVDARVGAISRRSGSPPEAPQAGRRQAMWAGAGVGAGLTGIVVLIVNARHATSDLVGSVIAIWVILVITALGATLVRKYRSPERPDN
jgi:hypothetical protein